MAKSCSVDGCSRKYNAKGYCGMHGLRVARHGDPYHVGKWQLSKTGICSVDGCKSDHAAKGYCNKHWKQARNGQILDELLTCVRCATEFERPFKSVPKFCNADCRYAQQLEDARNDPERRRENIKRWRTNNPERFREHLRQRRARKISSDARVVTDGDMRRLVARYNGKCGYCNESDYDHIDHIVPLSQGGRHAIGNLMPACAFCNLSKHAKLLSDWRYRKAAGKVMI